MKRLITLTTLGIISLGLFAQNYTDALRYSKNQFLGTARFNAMGGSFGALGGDATSLTVNPAGIGVYRNSEFTFTTGFLLNKTESNYRNSFSDDTKLNFNVGNIAYIGSYKGDPNGFKNYSFAFGYNRTSSFHTDLNIVGSSKDRSIVDDYVNLLNSNEAFVLDVEEYAYPFGPSHAYWNYLINPTSDYSYVREVQNTSSISQREQTNRYGSTNETFFSFGGNYQDRLFLGTTLSLNGLRFDEERTFTEEYNYSPSATPQDSIAVSYEETTDLISRGTGFTAKFGAIYKVTQAIRIGAAIHTPTFWGITEEYSFNSESSFSEGRTYNQEEETFTNWEYRIRTPWRYTASLAYLYLNKAAFNVDYEYVDYAQMRFDDKRDFEYDYNSQNADINSLMKGTHNIRFGMEYLLSPFVARAGFRYEDNPFNANELAFNPDQSRKTFSLGGGFRSGNYNFDITYMLSTMSELDPVYQSSESFARLEETAHRLVFTMGWKW